MEKIAASKGKFNAIEEMAPYPVLKNFKKSIWKIQLRPIRIQVVSMGVKSCW